MSKGKMPAKGTKTKRKTPEKKELDLLIKTIKALNGVQHNPINWGAVIGFVAPIVARLAARVAIRYTTAKLKKKLKSKAADELVDEVSDRLSEYTSKLK